MKYGIVHIVLKEGEVIFASEDYESANNYSSNLFLDATQEVLDEWGNDDPSEKDIDEAAFQAGYDGNCCEVESVDLTGLTENDVIELLDGTELDVSEIIDKLE